MTGSGSKVEPNELYRCGCEGGGTGILFSKNIASSFVSSCHSLPFSSSLGWQFDFRISSASEGGASHVFLLLNHDDDCDVWNGLQFKSDRQGNGPVYVGRSPGDQSGMDRDGERD